MKLFFILLFISSPILAAPKRKIILSYFKPFGGAPANHTSDVAKSVKAQMEKADKNIEVVLCPLHDQSLGDGVPVTFYSSRKDILLPEGPGPLKGKSAFESLKECYLQNPDASQVVSMGEGGCSVKVEGVARNIMSTGYGERLKDHGGNLIPSREEIIAGSAKIVKTDLVNIVALCLEQNISDEKVRYSTDPGTYVCNNLIYNFQKFVDFNSFPVSYSFIHVPPHLDRAQYCGSMPEFRATPDEVQTNETLTEGVGKSISAFIAQKEHVLKVMKKEKDLEGKLKVACDEKYEFKDDQLMDVSQEAFQSLKGLELNELMNKPLIRNCIKRNSSSQKDAPEQPLY